MPALHLIQNQTDPKLLPKPEKPGSDIWWSGYWSLAEATVRALVGGRVYFHRAQSRPALIGGELLNYRVADEPPYAGRIILVFHPDASAKGITTNRDGWAMEKKIVFDKPQP